MTAEWWVVSFGYVVNLENWPASRVGLRWVVSFGFPFKEGSDLFPLTGFSAAHRAR